MTNAFATDKAGTIWLRVLIGASRRRSNKVSGWLARHASGKATPSSRFAVVVLGVAQFPATLTDATGTFTKPAAW
jgi:hypothetical protein